MDLDVLHMICHAICFASMPVMAYFRRFLRMRMRGRHCPQPYAGTSTYSGPRTPSILPSIQCFGAFTRFKWVLGPRAMVAVHTVQTGYSLLSYQLSGDGLCFVASERRAVRLRAGGG